MFTILQVNFCDLKTIREDMCALPAQAFHCALRGVSSCSEDSIAEFNDLLETSLEAEVLTIDKDHLYHIILRVIVQT